MSEVRAIPGRTVAFAHRAVSDALEHDIISFAAAIAFYTALSFAPLVLLLVSLGGLLGTHAQSELLGLFSEQLGPQAGDVARGVVEASNREIGTAAPWWQGALSTAGLLATASAVFAELQTALNRVWEVETKPREERASSSRWRTLAMSTWRWLRKRLISMGMVLVVLFILLVSLVLSAIFGALAPGGGGAEIAARAAEFGISFVVATLLFAAIFKLLPDAPIAWRRVWLGAAVTSGLFNVGKLALALYIDKGGIGNEYGSGVGALIALLVWVYYSSIALLLGAEITRQMDRGAVDSQRRIQVA